MQASEEIEYQPGITREELERIAGEIGVSVQFLQQSINEAGSFESRRVPLHLTEEAEKRRANSPGESNRSSSRNPRKNKLLRKQRHGLCVVAGS